MSSYPPPGSWPPQPDGGSREIVAADDRNWAVAAHLGSFVAAPFVLGLVAPLVVLLLRGGDSSYVRRHAVESLNFQINAAVYGAIAWILVFTVLGIPLAVAYAAFYVVCVVVGAVRASSGGDFRYPLTLRVIS